MLGGAGVPAGAILDTMELTEDADFEQRGIMQTMEHPIAASFKMPAGRCVSASARRKSSRRRCLDNTQMKFWANGLVLTQTRSTNSAKTRLFSYGVCSSIAGRSAIADGCPLGP